MQLLAWNHQDNLASLYNSQVWTSIHNLYFNMLIFMSIFICRYQKPKNISFHFFYFQSNFLVLRECSWNLCSLDSEMGQNFQKIKSKCVLLCMPKGCQPNYKKNILDLHILWRLLFLNSFFKINIFDKKLYVNVSAWISNIYYLKIIKQL